MGFNRRAMLFLLAAFAPWEAVQACPDGQSSTSFGICLPNYSGPGSEEAERIKREAQAQLVGHQLAVWLQLSHDSAVGTSSPVPPNIRAALTGFISEDVLNAARYKVGDNGIFNAAGNIMSVNRDIAAVTLINVIVFRNAADAENDIQLWAHELTHVRQFQQSNVRDFAIRYARNVDSIEDEARNEETRYAKWVQARGTIPGPQYPYPSTMPQQAMATVCVTPYMTCSMAAVGPIGLSCYCPTYAGPIWGQSR